MALESGSFVAPPRQFRHSVRNSRIRPIHRVLVAHGRSRGGVPQPSLEFCGRGTRPRSSRRGEVPQVVPAQVIKTHFLARPVEHLLKGPGDMWEPFRDPGTASLLARQGAS